MTRFLVALVVFAALTNTLSAAVVDRAPFKPPQYDTIKGVSRYASADEYAAAVADKRFTLEKIAYMSGDLRVYAYLYAPATRSGKLPAVIFNRGSWVREDFAGELLTIFHRLGQAGFVVIAPALRGSAGGQGRDEMGGADLADIMEIANVVRGFDFIDTDNLFMYGESRGGMMTYQAIRDDFPVRAAAVYGAFTDLRGMLGANPKLASVVDQIWPDYKTQGGAIGLSRSALIWPERIDVPILIMHGTADEDVPPMQPMMLANQLQQRGQKYELIMKAGEKHTLSGWRVQRDQAAIDWFRAHMKK